MDLLSLGVKASRGLDPSRLQLVSCECLYRHYLCDGMDDRVGGGRVISFSNCRSQSSLGMGIH